MKKTFKDVKNKCIEFFEEKGLELNSENGSKIPLAKNCHSLEKKEKWSKDIFCLSKNGLVRGYYRNLNKKFTLSGFAINDLYLEDCKDNLLSLKFIKIHQLKKLAEFIK